MSLRIPPLLESYLALPPETSLLVLSGILGASTNWLVLRYLHSLLRPSTGPATAARSPEEIADAANPGPVSVLLVSFLRDFAFWKDGASRLGVDLEALGRQGRFGFVDGLSGLFLGPEVKARPPGQDWRCTLTSPEVADVGAVLHAAVDGLAQGSGNGKVVLVIDQLDFLLAAAGTERLGLQLHDLLLDLREVSSMCYWRGVC
jgi:elongator complex protein 6